VADLDRARRFYGEVLGLEAGKTWGDVDPKGAEFQAGNLTIALMDSVALGQPFVPGSGLIAFHVDDVASHVAQLRELGVEILVDTFDSGVCHQAILRDSEGNSIDLHNRYAD
jgi:predicted enzyme related to lactoylglutathione lyase